MAVERIQELIGLMQKNLECSICLELMKHPVATKCEHYFCSFCLTEFLGKKRSVPCPLCKQPITKRSLTEKGELNNIVSALSNLITAFQQDSGITYSPPGGPQMFFPCTPDTINSKPESRQQVKCRRNMRRSSRSSKQTGGESLPSVNEMDSSVLSEDGLAVPHIPSVSTGNLKPARRRKSPLTRQGPSCLTSVEADLSGSGQSRDRPTSKTRAAVTATCSNTNDQLLHYLDENSCGLQKETQDSKSMKQTSNIPEPKHNSGNTKVSDHQLDKDQEARGTEAQRQGEENKLISPAEQTVVQNNEVVRITEESQEYDANMSGGEADFHIEQSPHSDLKTSHSNKGELNNEQLDVDCKEKLSQRITRRTVKNGETRPQAAKEDLTNSEKPASCNRKNEEHKNTGLAFSSQNSSDEGSVSSTQQFQRPLPVVTKTYSKRFGGRNGSEKKVEDWIACLPTDLHRSGHQPPEQNQQKTVLNECGQDQSQTMGKEGNASLQDNDANPMNSGVTETGNDNEKSIMRDTSRLEEGNQALTTSMPEEYEEFILTPPVRKKRIFKRKSAKNDKDSRSSTLQEVQENSPPADPYAFVVGHTPVAKSKKRGRSKAKEKTGKPPVIQSFSLNPNEKKTVRFSGAPLEMIPSTSSFIAENKEEQRQADGTIIVSDQVNCSEKPQDLPPHDVDAAVEGTDAVHASGSSFVRPGTRSRLKTQSKTTEKNSRGRNKEMPQQRNTRRRMTNKDQKEDPEAEKIREEQTEQLASWIGQAEDYDLLFSTQEAQACIESMHTEENREKASMDGKDDAMDMGNGEAIALREEDENSNDGLCLVGPIGDDGPSTMDISAQSANFDMIAAHSASDQNAAEGNIKLFDSANFKPNAGNDAAQTGSATSVAMHSKPSDTPETKERESSTRDMNFPSRLSPSGSRKKVDAIPETQLSTLESPALSGIVLPSPAVGAAFPKFSTPIIQAARQRRSCELGQGVSAGGVDGTPQKESIPAEANRTTNCRKQDGDMATASVENSASARLNKTSAGDDPDHLTALSLNPPSPTAKKAMHKLSFPSPVVKVKSSLPEQEGENAKGSAASPSPRDSPRSMTGRLRRQKRGSSNRSPLVTAIPSTFTEDSSAHVTCVSASTEDQQEQLGKEMALASAQQPPSSREEPEEARDESEAVATVASSTDGTDKAERKGKHQSPMTEKIKSTVQRTGVDPDGEGDSSSTEDLDVDPAEHEFEEADLSLQLEEVQLRYSTGQGIQDEENASQNFSDGADVPSEVKMSLPSESNAVVGENYEQTKKGKMTPFNKPHTDDKVDMNLESAEMQSPPNLSSVTQIPETLDVEESTRKTKTVPGISQTQDGRKEGEHDDSQKSHKTTLTDSSTLEVNSRCDSFSLTQAQQVPHGPSTESSKNVITSSLNGDNQSSSASVSPSQSILQPFGGEKQSAAGQSSLCSDNLALSASPSQSILQPIGGEKLPVLEVEKRSAIGPSSLNSDNQTSSASATPSQSILQPIGVEKQSAVGQSEQNIQQSESTTPNQSLFQSVKANHTVNPKYTSQSEGKLGSLQRPGGNKIPVHQNCTADDQPVTGNKNVSDEAPYTGCTSSLAVSEVDEVGEKKQAHEGEVCGSDGQAQPKLLVQDTQDCGATDDQSLSILSQHIVQESVPEHKESSQPFDAEMHPQTNSVDLHAEGCPTSALKSPGQKLPVSEDEFRGLTPTATQNQNVNSPAVSLSPSVACPSSRKRKLPEEDEDHTASVPVCPKIPTPELVPCKSPSAAFSKVISSAPPRATSLLSDSDDGDAVPIVRRTKRKCFSLEGSPLKRKTPPSKKRGRYCRKQKNLSEEFDKEADSGAKQTAQEQNLSQLCGEYTEGNAKSEKVQNTSLSDEHGTKRINGKLTKDGNDETSIEGTNTGNITELMSEQSAESVKSKDRSKTTPLQMRKKTVRGLAQRKAELSDSDAENGCGHVTPGIHPAHNAEKSGSQIGTNMDRSDGPMFDTKGQLTDQRKVLIHVSDDEDPMEVDDMGISADSGRKNLIHTDHQNQTEAGPSHLDSDESISVDNQPLVSHGSAGSADKPIMITQSSDKSETQRPPLEILSSVPASADDATIPPSSFDLRFDEDEEDDESATPRGLAGQGIEKTGNNMAVSQESRSSVGNKYAEKADRTTEQNEREKNEKQSCSEVEQIAERKRTEGTDEAVPTEILNQNEAGLISSTGEVKLSGGSEKPTPSSEEEEVVVMKKKKPVVIDSDSDSESDQGSDLDSEASQQLNFTSSSAVSSQSEVITTQERSKMESELERLRREIAEMEAKLHGQNSSRSDSTGDRKDSGTSARNETVSALALDDDSSGDEMEESSGEKVKRRRRAGRSSSGSTSASRVKRPRRYQRISSDEDDDEQGGKQPRQQRMDTYLCSVKVEGGDPVTEPTPVPVKAPVTPAKVTSDKKVKNRDSLIISDEDSSDLFLSPLSPSPPPPIKHTLARAEPYERPQSAFSLDSPSLAVNRCGTKFRQALDFATGRTDQKGSAEGEVDKHSDNKQDSPEPNTGLLGKVKKIPESQFSASDRMNDVQEPDLDMTQQGSLDYALRENLNTCNVDDVDSSGSPLPSPLIGGVLKLGENKENAGEESDDQPDDDDLPRWRRKKCGFISSGLDQEKSSLLRKLAEANECKVYSKFNDYVTHVIIKTEEGSRVCERTLKYFQGIACQCWVLSFDWVVQSLSNGSFVPEKKYEIRGDTVKGDDHKGPRLSRLSSSGLLVGFAFAPVGVSSDMSKKELTQLLTLCGGEVVEDPWDLASHQADHKLVLRCVDSEASPPTPAEIELFNGQYKHFGLVTVAREWILDSVSTHCLQPLKEYVFNTCPNLHLPL